MIYDVMTGLVYDASGAVVDEDCFGVDEAEAKYPV